MAVLMALFPRAVPASTASIRSACLANGERRKAADHSCALCACAAVCCCVCQQARESSLAELQQRLERRAAELDELKASTNAALTRRCAPQALVACIVKMGYSRVSPGHEQLLPVCNDSVRWYLQLWLLLHATEL